MKPIGYLFVGFPLGALWMGLWMHTHLQRAARQLKQATERELRAREIYRKIVRALREGKVPQ